MPRLTPRTDSINPSKLEDVALKLFRHDCRYGDCPPRWSKFSNHDDEEIALEETASRESIIHRYASKNKRWNTVSFTIQNHQMQEHLNAVLAGYEDYSPELESWTFKPPYSPLVHRWSDLLQRQKDPSLDTEARKAIEELLEFLEPILSATVRAVAETNQSGKIGFGSIWQIFPPGEVVVTTIFGVEMLGRVTRFRDQGVYHDVHIEFVDWNGITCGYSDTVKRIRAFSDLAFINSLDVYPLRFHNSAEDLQNQLLKRGRYFEQLRGYHLQDYKGTQQVFNEELDTFEEKFVSGRVMIDAYAKYSCRNQNLPSFRSLQPVDSERNRRLSSWKNTHREQTDHEPHHQPYQIPNHQPSHQPSHQPYQQSYQQSYQQPYHQPVCQMLPSMQPQTDHRTRRRPLSPERGDSRSRSRSRSPLNEPPYRFEPRMERAQKASMNSVRPAENLVPLTDDECRFATPWVNGMDLKTKTWGLFSIDGLSEVVWNDEAFENLVLPANQKHLGWAFVENKALAERTFDDFIDDKGRGIIILMFGPPGVGKTFTSEAVAERARIPLYALSAATLGITPGNVERALDYALHLCKLWGAMLLLDEADVFISARNDSDLARNELVALFLTKLEYYQGICFMTTNRMASIDPAMQSRVDLFLRYQNLNIDAKRQVWKNFFSKSGTDLFSVTEMELEELVKYDLNGREIKNLIKSAHLLSLKEKKQITFDMLSMLATNRLQALEALALGRENNL